MTDQVVGVFYGLSIASFLILIPISILNVVLWVKVIAMEKSTHQVQYVNPFEDLPNGEDDFIDPTEEQKDEGLEDIDFKNIV